MRHIDHLVEIAGIDCVGLGSDFDYILPPNDLTTVAEMPNLVQALKDRGYQSPALNKLLYDNWVRILGLTWA